MRLPPERVVQICTLLVLLSQKAAGGGLENQIVEAIHNQHGG